MMGRVIFEISAPYRELLARHGLDSFVALFDCAAGQHVDGHADRNVVRLALQGTDGRETALYLKREWQPKPALLLRRMLAALLRPPPSRCRGEWDNLRALRRLGLQTAEPVAVGEERSGLFYRRALLVVREVPGAVSLAGYLEGFPAQPRAADLAAKRALARELGELVRRMHDAGWAYRDLYAKHVLLSTAPQKSGTEYPSPLTGEGEPPKAGRVRVTTRGPSPGHTLTRPDSSGRRVGTTSPFEGEGLQPAVSASFAQPTLIDAQRARRFRRACPRAARHDLAALAATTTAPACTRTDRLRFLLAYARERRLTPVMKRLARQVADRAARLSGKGGDPRLSQRSAAEPGAPQPPGPGFKLIDQRRILAGERLLPELARLGLDKFEAVMGYRGGEVYRDAAGRLTVRIPATCAGRPSAIYLKRHQRVDAREWLKGLLLWRRPRTRAQTEYSNISLLAHFGIATVTPAALGQDRRWRLRQQSFLMTEEIPGGAPADDYLRARFGTGAPDAEARKRKRELVRDIARLVRRFHRCGFWHRDLYLCHVFVREVGGSGGREGEPALLRQGYGGQNHPPYALHLIDLQRVRWRRDGRVGRRWLVKDLAALNYSAPAGAITRTDKVRFLREYLAQGRLDAAARRLVRSVLAKTCRIARHDAKLRARSAGWHGDTLRNKGSP